MTQTELLKTIEVEGATLKGTTRPMATIQLDKWVVNGKEYIVTTDMMWIPGVSSSTHMRHSYNPKDVLYCEMLIKLPI